MAIGQTVTSKHHDELLQIGIIPSLKGMIPAHKFPYVIFCAPPYQTTDYPGDVRLAVSNWNHEGCFLFTSSSAPYDCNDNGPYDEDSPVEPIGRSPRTDVLLQAQQVALEAGGCVVRLAGLYGAASLSVAILKKNLRGRIFLGCGKKVMDLVKKSGIFSKKFVGFTGTSDPLRKRLKVADRLL